MKNQYTKQLEEIKNKVLKAKKSLFSATTEQKNEALYLIKQALLENKNQLFEANQKDLEIAKNNNLTEALLDRLILNQKVFASMVASLEKIIDLDDPIGSLSKTTTTKTGLKIAQMRNPLGIILTIYESRPNVSLDAASLCLKSSNVALLKGGSEAINSNKAIAKAIKQGLIKSQLDENSIVLIENTDRSFVQELIKAKDFIDIIIPRGGKGLIETINQNASIPVISHLDGNCHIFVDSYADLKMAKKIVINAKTRRFGVCNALESLLIDQKVSDQFLADIASQLSDKKIELRVCKKSSEILTKKKIKHLLATKQDYFTEFLAPIISIKIVDDIDQAIKHINHYGSGHTDAIITNYLPHSEKFLKAVDSSSVMLNTSTSFADGFEYGLGAEIGISTNKIHVRGPVGLEGLTNQKYIVISDGKIRA